LRSEEQNEVYFPKAIAVVGYRNVTGGLDMTVDWNVVHREVIRRGHAYVAVSAQKVGIEGGPGPADPRIAPLKKADPQRYGRLNHPGDAYSFEIVSQAGKVVTCEEFREFTGDAVKFELRWACGAYVPKSDPSGTRIRFVLKNADLFAVGLVE